MKQSRSPDAQTRVLVVDDEPNIREMIAINLQREGLQVVFAEDGHEAIEAARAHEPDLIVLDIMMPGIDGFQVCRTIREESTVPILLLSARGEEIDRIVGLELGADDFLVKPFAMRELVARVRAMLRRARMASANGPDEAPIDPGSGIGLKSQVFAQHQTINAGDVTIDTARREATLGGTVLALKPKEFDLLVYFARHPGIVLTRDALLREVWGYDFPVDTRTVDVHVRWLRQKIEQDPSLPLRIQTMRGHGYRFVTHDG
ncbi:MAG: response regulator transcription factor [Chloroflexia bacterium]|nr:response regulator transcription factor [Chloroflexia bacterium]